jgi:RNA polymerase sigma-70 factor (ECF subfamily)
MNADRYQEFLAGYESAEKELFTLVHPRLITYAAKLLNNKEDAKDVVFEKINHFYRNRSKYETYERFKSHLITAVRYACYDYVELQNKKRQALKGLPPVEDEVEMIAGYIKDELIEILIKELLNLPENMRKPLQMYYLQKRSLKEIAIEMGKTYENMAAYMGKSRTRLKENLRKQGIHIPVSFICWWLTQ